VHITYAFAHLYTVSRVKYLALGFFNYLVSASTTSW
jgi:hypothetical protein